jgi:urate oxidase
MATLIFDTYGKNRVRLLRVTRDGSRHEIVEWNTQILFEGDLAESYMAGDNSKVLPTDTMKNTVYALARKTPIVCVEQFARDLGRHFLGRLPHLRQVKIEIEATPWSRIEDYDAAFAQAGKERRMAACTITRSQETSISGIRNLQILKTAGSSFAGYPKDEYTTLPETDDRLLGTVLDADWSYSPGTHDFNGLHTQIRARLLATFALHRSLSVQHTLYAMAESVVAEFGAVSQIHLIMPNKHYLLADLSKFGLDNPNQIFVPTDEPFGYIEATVGR